jgi:hypothetical protein
MKYVRKLTVVYNNCIQDIDFYVRHALTFVNVPNFQISHDETLDNKPVKCRVARRPGFRGTSRIQSSVSRVPIEPFLGRELCRIWSIAGLLIPQEGERELSRIVKIKIWQT